MAQLVTRRGRKEQCRRNAAESLDRFSSLPDHIVHHIFSFLPFKYTARVGVLSKTCRQLFLSNPYLDFTANCSNYGPTFCKQFSDFVDGLMSQRNGMEISRFRLHWGCRKDGSCDVDVTGLTDKWINIAGGCRVQEIDLAIPGTYYLRKVFELPQYIFSSRSLRILKLDLWYNCVEEPGGVFVSLEELSVCKFNGFYPGHALKKLISTSCPLLKRLKIKDSIGIPNLSIVSPCLEEFKLRGNFGCYLREIDISTEKLQKLSLELQDWFAKDPCIIKIDAPNLQELKWADRAANNNISLSRFELLKNVTLKINCKVCLLVATALNSLNHLLQSTVVCARMLQLNLGVLETRFIRNCLPAEMRNLQRLVVTARGCLLDYHFPVLASFLVQAPNLEYFSLKCRASEPVDDRVWKPQQWEGTHCQIRHAQLKEIEIELDGEVRNVQIIKSLLTFAKGLKKLTIFYTKENSEALSRIGLNKSRTLFLTLEVILVEKESRLLFRSKNPFDDVP